MLRVAVAASGRHPAVSPVRLPADAVLRHLACSRVMQPSSDRGFCMRHVAACLGSTTSLWRRATFPVRGPAAHGCRQCAINCIVPKRSVATAFTSLHVRGAALTHRVLPCAERCGGVQDGEDAGGGSPEDRRHPGQLRPDRGTPYLPVTHAPIPIALVLVWREWSLPYHTSLSAAACSALKYNRSMPRPTASSICFLPEGVPRTVTSAPQAQHPLSLHS